MPKGNRKKYYCEYCGIYLANLGPWGRKTHRRGKKHLLNKAEYYNRVINMEIENKQRSMKYKMGYNGMPGMPGMPGIPGMPLIPGSIMPISMNGYPEGNQINMQNQVNNHGIPNINIHGNFPNSQNGYPFQNMVNLDSNQQQQNFSYNPHQYSQSYLDPINFNNQFIGNKINNSYEIRNSNDNIDGHINSNHLNSINSDVNFSYNQTNHMNIQNNNNFNSIQHQTFPNDVLNQNHQFNHSQNHIHNYYNNTHNNNFELGLNENVYKNVNERR